LIGCSQKEARNDEINSGNLIKKFSLKQFSNKINLFIDGEAAEIKSKNIKVKKPSLLIDRKTEVIEIKTGKEGKAEIEVNPENKQIENVIFTGSIKIIQKDKRTEKIIMEAECGKLFFLFSSDFQSKYVLETTACVFNASKGQLLSISFDKTPQRYFSIFILFKIKYFPLYSLTVILPGYNVL